MLNRLQRSPVLLRSRRTQCAPQILCWVALRSTCGDTEPEDLAGDPQKPFGQLNRTPSFDCTYHGEQLGRLDRVHWLGPNRGKDIGLKPTHQPVSIARCPGSTA